MTQSKATIKTKTTGVEEDNPRESEQFNLSKEQFFTELKREIEQGVVLSSDASLEAEMEDFGDVGDESAGIADKVRVTGKIRSADNDSLL